MPSGGIGPVYVGPAPTMSPAAARSFAQSNPCADRNDAICSDISGVTQSLGVAFNSTLIALMISIVVMFLRRELQLQQERLVLDTETYLDQHLIQHLRIQ